MRKIGWLFIFMLLCAGWSSAETYSSWKTYLAYYNTTEVAEGNAKVFAVADGSLYIYGKDDKSVTFYSKEKGLSDNSISMMKYNASTNSLLLFYSDGNIDLMDESNNITNLPYLKDNTNIQDKTVNNVNIYGDYAYLSMNFGVLVVNMKKKEIAETYKLSRAVYSVCLDGNTIYAATATGIIHAASSSNLLDANNWSSLTLNDASVDATAIRQIVSFDGMLCFWVKGNGVFYRKNDGTITSLRKHSTLNGMTLENGKLIPYSSSQAFIYSSLTSSFTINADTIHDVSSMKDENIYWLASGYSGIKCVEKNSSGSFAVTVSDLLDNTASPKRNLDAFLLFHANRLLIAGGGRWLDRYYNPGTLMVYDSSRWTNFNETKIASAAKIKFSDVTSIAVDPADNNHYFVSTWGEGVFEFKNNEFINLYSLSNSPLKSALSGSSSANYVRVDGLTYDSKGNLWMTNTAGNGNGGICILKSDGTWLSYSDGNYYPLKNQNLIDKVLITSNGDKWVNIARGSNAGIFVFNDNGTLDDTSDDNTKLYTTLTSTSGAALTVSGYYCMAEDKSNQIWIGTNSGLVVCSNPNDALNGKAYFTHITRADSEGTLSYFLNGEKINAIAVDGGNRKWIGTEGSGVFVISADGSETISSFTTSNSPLLSDEILSIAIDNTTGEVFIGTSKGLVSYMSGATSGAESYSNVYAYPNPVRPEFDDKVTITGLMEGSNVKITDLSGNIIFQTKSLGGQATWNCCNKSGNRVATGVYLVMAATEDSSNSVVTKIMVVK